MMSQGKTHYRKVFKSDHLGIADLEDLLEQGSNLIFTIKQVRQEIGVKVAGRKIDANIAYFNEPIKPLVLNATNSKTVKKLAGGTPFIEDWKNVSVQLYADPNVKMKGETVGGVRINPNTPVMQKREVTKDTPQMWENAKRSYKEKGNFNNVLAKADISEENQSLMIQEINDEVS